MGAITRSMLAVALLAALLDQSEAVKRKARVVCYFSYWAVDRKGNGSYGLDDIPFDKCTHIVYSFVGLNKDTWKVKPLDTNDKNNAGLTKFTAEVQKKGKKALLAIGGQSEGVKKYSDMVSNEDNRKKLIKSLVKYMNDYNFDGLDLDWEYPGWLKKKDMGKITDKDNFREFVKELREEFNKENGKTWEISMAVPATKYRLDAGYHVWDLCKMVDAVHVMTYDLRGASWTNFIDAHSPLKSRTEVGEDYKLHNVEDGLLEWVNKGCPKWKLIVGVPFYGNSFKLKDTNKHAPGDKHSGEGSPGELTNQDGWLAYYEICKLLQTDNSDWTEGYDDVGKVPYAYSALDKDWVGFENADSLKLKMDHIENNGYGGAMTWAVDLDDFKGTCGTKNPLMNKLHTAMKDLKVSCYSYPIRSYYQADVWKQPTQQQWQKDLECPKYRCINEKEVECKCPKNVHSDLTLKVGKDFTVKKCSP